MKMRSTFVIASGREVWIESVSIRNTYECLILGDPVHVSRDILKDLPETLTREYGVGAVWVKQAPDKALPRYRFVAELHSKELPSPEPADYSLVKLCWFQGSLDVNLFDTVHSMAMGLEWEKHAVNWLM